MVLAQVVLEILRKNCRGGHNAPPILNRVKIRNMGEYHDLYLKTNTILLANVFESFRSVCIENYGLDPAHFCTAPGLAWNACLKKTGIRLELLLDPDMLLMFERGIRGGITQSVHRWAAANNPYIESMMIASQPNTFNTQMPTTYMIGQCLNCYQLVGSDGLNVKVIRID